MPMRIRGCTPGDAAQQVGVAHAGIDQDDRGADLEQGKGQADEIGRGLDHQHGPVARPHPSLLQIAGIGRRSPAQFGKAQPPARPHLDEADGLALPLCHLVQGRGNILRHHSPLP